MLSITGSGSLEAASSNTELQAVTADCFKTVIAESRSVEAVSNEQLQAVIAFYCKAVIAGSGSCLSQRITTIL